MPEMDYAAFRAIYDTYWEKVYKYAQKILGNTPLAEDVVQHVFVSLWERRKLLQMENTEAYLIRAVKFACLTELKKTQRYRDLGDVDMPETKSELKADDYILHKDLEKTIDYLLKPVAGKCQQMFRMRFEQGLDNHSIASHLDLSEKTVRNKLSQTIGMIREKLKLQGYK